MTLNSTRAGLGVVASMLLTGCATNKDELLPHGPTTMREVWDQHTGASIHGTRTRALYEAREALRRRLSSQESATLQRRAETYTRTAHNEVVSQFHRLPNPDLVMYVFPHLGGDLSVPVPGYSTIFPLHERVEYAMPGERTEDY